VGTATKDRQPPSRPLATQVAKSIIDNCQGKPPLIDWAQTAREVGRRPTSIRRGTAGLPSGGQEAVGRPSRGRAASGQVWAVGKLLKNFRAALELSGQRAGALGSEQTAWEAGCLSQAANNRIG
jgi:hypothetical protein